MTITMATHMGTKAKSPIMAMIMEVVITMMKRMDITVATALTMIIMMITMIITTQDQKRWTPIFK